MVKSSPGTAKKRHVSEAKAVSSIACVMEHAEDADLKYIIKVLNATPKMKPVLAGLLRDGTFQRSIELKAAPSDSTMLPPSTRGSSSLVSGGCWTWWLSGRRSWSQARGCQAR